MVNGDGLVYVIDDDASLRRSLRNLLGSVGFWVKTFESAEAFLEFDDRVDAACLVIDLRMPGMSGIDLLRHLSSSGARHRAIVLTAHGDDTARKQSIAAGAIAFLQKPFQSAALVDAVRRALSTIDPPPDARRERKPGVASTADEEPLMAATAPPIDLAGGALGSECHVCAFFSSAEEEHRVLRAFIKEGLDGGEKAIHIVDPRTRADYLARLAEGGIDVERVMGTGQLDVPVWEETYLCDDCFDQEAMLRLVEETLQTSVAAGYPRTRIVAHMEWALLDKPGGEYLLEYEARANQLLPKYHAPAICAYDLTKFTASDVMDILRAHPMAIIGGVLRENPFYVPPDQYLVEIRERRSASKSPSIAS